MIIPGIQASHVSSQIAGLCFLVQVPAISLFILARQQAAVVKTPLALLLELGHPIQTNHDHLHFMVAKKWQLGFTSGLSTIYCSRRRCSGSCCMTSGTGCTSILEIYSTVFSDSFSYLASQKQKKKACVQKSIDLFRTLQTNVAHSNPNHSLRHTHSWTDFESVRRSTAIASRGASSHGRSTSVSSRCPENDENISRRNSKTSTHIILLEGPPTPLAGPLRPGWEALAPPTPRPAALPTPGPPVP